MSNDTYQWQPAPKAELHRLAKLLASHLRKARVLHSERSLPNCSELVRQVLEKQRGTCFLAGGDDRYCWNHPKDGNIGYLKLEWGHKVPLSQGGTSDLSNLVLMCARCNNHIQTSRTLRQLVPELEHKLAVLRSGLDA
jgi:5-methylcytosine-specific restriction endonuclease McrA